MKFRKIVFVIFVSIFINTVTQTTFFHLSQAAEDNIAPAPLRWRQSGNHSYFDLLSAMPEAILSKAYRTQAEIDADDHGGPGDVVYDTGEDAAKFTIDSGDGSIDTVDQLRPNFTATNTGNLLFFWEAQWESGFVADGGIDGLKNHKAFQLARDGKLSIEPRCRFSKVNSPYVARVDVRGYGNKAGYSQGAAETIAPQDGEFNILPDVWVRHWFLLDFDNKKVWYWIGDENRANVTILDNVDFDFSVAFSTKFDEFWFEFDSSQDRTAGTPVLNIWGRNLVVLKDVTGASSIVAQGDSGGQN
jgi:hypothetical protein